MKRQSRSKTATTTFLLFLSIGSNPLLAGSSVEVVLGPNAPRLEQFAAEELKGYLQRLFQADVRLSNRRTGDAKHVILLGSPATNPAVRSAMGAQWPKLTDQGFVLRSLPNQSAEVLVLGGGSPVATLWAAYELGHHFGVRYLLSGDVFPSDPGVLNLDRLKLVCEPALKIRSWRTINDFAIGPESWGLEEHRQVLRQLAKNKFNRVMLQFYPWQPFVHYEFRGVPKSTAMLWFGYRYRVDGDTAGKVVFGGAKEFINPEFAGKTSYEEMTEAGTRLARGIIEEARRLGMSTAIAISPLEFPKEFAAVLPGAKVLRSLEQLVVGPGPKQPPDDPLLRELVETKIRAYLNTYPEIDAIYLTIPEFPDWVEHYRRSWKRLEARYALSHTLGLEQMISAARDRTLIASGNRGVQAVRGNITALDFFSQLLADRTMFRRSDGRRVRPVIVQIDPALFPVLDEVISSDTGLLHFVDYTARRVAANRDQLGRLPASMVGNSSLILTLADDNVGVLPQMATRSIHVLMQQIRQAGWGGFSTRYWMIGDLDPVVHYLARGSFDQSVTPEGAYDDLITAMCGPGVAERLTLGFNMIEQATELIDKNNIGFAFPVPGMVMKHYRDRPVPPWWTEVKRLYNEAMIEMFRGKDRARLAGRPFILYFAKRAEFGVQYMTSVEALRLAAQAKAKGDNEKMLEQLEIALEAMYNGIDALRTVARDNSDRGLIAVLNQYGYKPLLKEFEAQLDKVPSPRPSPRSGEREKSAQ